MIRPSKRLSTIVAISGERDRRQKSAYSCCLAASSAGRQVNDEAGRYPTARGRCCSALLCTSLRDKYGCTLAFFNVAELA